MLLNVLVLFLQMYPKVVLATRPPKFTSWKSAPKVPLSFVVPMSVPMTAEVGFKSKLFVAE